MEKDLERRITILEDIEEIKKLKSRYGYNIDERDWDSVLDFYAEDATVDFGVFGKYEGKEAIRKFFKETLPPATTFSMHMSQDPIIEVKGNRAKGKWYLHESATFTEGNQAVWGAVKYEDEFVKRKGKWRCKSCLVNFLYLTPYEEGWVKKKMIV